MVNRGAGPLDQLLDEIRFQRRKELRAGDPGFTVARNTTYWTDLFVRHFLFQSDRNIDSDDLLFFVRKVEYRTTLLKSRNLLLYTSAWAE